MANKDCRKGAVRVNGNTVKPSREVIPTDTVAVRRNQIWFEFEVLDLPKSRVGAKLVDIYRRDITAENADKNHEVQALARVEQRQKGLGRPTKKDRRDLDEFTEEDGIAEILLQMIKLLIFVTHHEKALNTRPSSHYCTYPAYRLSDL